MEIHKHKIKFNEMDATLKQALNWAALIGGAVILVICVRTFFIGSYRISTPSMENALLKGDYVLVNKFHLGGNALKRNDIFLFTSPLLQDEGNAPLLVSRCIALPGDTIQVSDEGYRVNGVLYPRSPTSLSTYTFSKDIQNLFLNTLRKLNIPVREMEAGASSVNLQLTSFEEYQIREELTAAMNASFVRPATREYMLVVPRKNDSYSLNEASLVACREAIRLETKDKAVFRNNRLYINETEAHSFRFSRDYYWALSDNTNEAVDSRHVGFIPAGHIIGKAWFCWYSSDSRRRLKRID